MLNRHRLASFPDLLENPAVLAKIKTRDHFIPKSQGGQYTVAACRECNTLRGCTDAMEFRDVFRPHIPVELIRKTLVEAKFFQSHRKPHNA